MLNCLFEGGGPGASPIPTSSDIRYTCYELVSYLGFRAHQLNKAIWCPLPMSMVGVKQSPIFGITGAVTYILRTFVALTIHPGL